jgi:hypothetical protein
MRQGEPIFKHSSHATNIARIRMAASVPLGDFGARKTELDLAARFEPLIRLLRPICNGACRPALGGIIMKQFFFAVALTFAVAAGAVTVLTVQLSRAAAQ